MEEGGRERMLRIKLGETYGRVPWNILATFFL